MSSNLNFPKDFIETKMILPITKQPILVAKSNFPNDLIEAKIVFSVTMRPIN